MMITLRNGRQLRVGPGWQHSYKHTHYRISTRQAQGLDSSIVPVGVVLHIDVPLDTDCPCCSTHGHDLITGRWWRSDHDEAAGR